MAHAFESVVFYRCSHCGNVVAKVIDQGVPLVCCGEPMKALKPGTSDGAVEKHLPVVQVENGAVHVQVGSASVWSPTRAFTSAISAPSRPPKPTLPSVTKSRWPSTNTATCTACG